MKFGINVVPVYPTELATFARRAEELGFESLWYGEHVATPARLTHAYPGGNGTPPFGPDSRFLDAFGALNHLAAATRTIRLGTGIVIAPLYSPMQLARAVTTLDVLSGGRTLLGLGVGWMREEFDIVDRGFTDRGGRLDEQLEILSRLFTENRVTYAGRHYDIPEVGFSPKPVQQPRPPFLIGGESPAALRRAALHGDGWYGGSGSPEQIAGVVEHLRGLRADAGRTGPFEISCLLSWGEGHDSERVAAYTAAGVDRLVATPWAHSREALAATEHFAAAAGLVGAS